MANPRLALAIDDSTTRLRLSFNDLEIAAYRDAAALAERRLGEAPYFDPEEIQRRTDDLAAAQARLASAEAYAVSGSNPGTTLIRAGEVLHIASEYAYVRNVAPDWIDVARESFGSRAVPHDAGTELVPVILLSRVEGFPDPTAGDAYFVHEQFVASTVWDVVHNLGKKPSVTVVDSGDTFVIGDVAYLDENELLITFTAAFGGRAYLS